MNFPLVEGSNLEQSLQLIKLSEPNNSFFYFREMHSLEAGKGCNTTGPFSTRNAQKRKYLCHLQHVLKGPHSSLCLYLPPLQQSQVLPGHHCWDWLPCLYWTEFFVWPVRTNKETTLNTSLEITKQTPSNSRLLWVSKIEFMNSVITKAKNRALYAQSCTLGLWKHN